MKRLLAMWTVAEARTRPARLWASFLLPPVVLLAWAKIISAAGRWPAGDGPHQLGTAMRLSHLLRDGELSLFAWCFQSLLGPHPPLAYLPATLSYFLVGTVWRWGHLVAGAMALWLCWDGVRRLGGGLVGALFLGATGLIWLQAESYGVDLLAAAAVIQSISHLAASERLEKRRHVWAWGLWMGAGFLIKYTAPIFLAGPCLLAGWWVVRHKRWRALAEGFGAFVLIAGGWYATHYKQVMGYVGASGDSGNELLTNRALVTGPWYDWENLNWYPAAAVDAYGWPGVVAIGVGVIWWQRKPRVPTGAWALPLLAAGGGWLVLAMQTQRQDRYLLPAYPLLAAIAGSSRPRWLLAPVAAIGLYGASAVYRTYTDVPPVRAYTHSFESAGAAWPWVYESYLPTSLAPTHWQIDGAVERLARHETDPDATVGLLLDEQGGAPGFGLMLSRVASPGHRWNLATIMLMDRGGGPGRAAVFVGPFTIGRWPSRNFRTLLAILRTGDRSREAWLTATGMELAEQWELPGGREGRIYVGEFDVEAATMGPPGAPPGGGGPGGPPPGE